MPILKIETSKKERREKKKKEKKNNHHWEIPIVGSDLHLVSIISVLDVNIKHDDGFEGF